jgi:predicted nucleotidyltransferase
MKRSILQIPINPELRAKAEQKAESLGFSSAQEMIWVMLTQLTTGINLKIDDICENHHINYVGLFGSAAREEAKSDSDIDLLVKFDDQSGVGLFELDRIQREFENRFGKKVDLVTRLNNYILPEALKDLITIYQK